MKIFLFLCLLLVTGLSACSSSDSSYTSTGRYVSKPVSCDNLGDDLERMNAGCPTYGHGH